MIIALLTPMMLATAPPVWYAPPYSYSHETQTTAGLNLAQNGQPTGSHNTTNATLRTQTCDSNGNNCSMDDQGSDATVSDPDGT